MTSFPPSSWEQVSDPKFDIHTATKSQLANLVIPDDATSIDVGSHSLVYIKTVTATVKEHKKAANYIIESHSFKRLEKTRAHHILLDLEEYDDDVFCVVWYVGETVRTFKESCDKAYPKTIEAHKNIA